MKFSQEFSANVSWQKIDKYNGAEIPDEDIIDGGGNESTPTPNGEDDLKGLSSEASNRKSGRYHKLSIFSIIWLFSKI